MCSSTAAACWTPGRARACDEFPVSVAEDGGRLASLRDAFALVHVHGAAVRERLSSREVKEVVVAGPLAEVGDRILEIREAARAANGWIMDVYLLRRR